MRQAVHILKKDVRHLWIEIAVVLAATGLFALIYTSPEFWHSKAQIPQTVAAFFVQFLLPVGWWVLIVRAVHGEPLTGDREFWTTRPYRWRSLLGAKLLLIVLFVNLPIAAAQAAILLAHGFHLSAVWSSLLWNQVLLTVALFLPVAAIGALTSGMVQFLLIGLVTWAVLLLLSLRLAIFASTLGGGTWGPLEWIRWSYALAVVAAAAPAILLWQYAERRTTAARAGAVAVVLVMGVGAPLSWTQAFAIQQRFSRQRVPTGIHAEWNGDFRWMTRALVRGGHGVDLNIPLRLSGVADAYSPRPEGLTVEIRGADGAVWRSSAVEPRSNVSSSGQLISLRTTLDEEFYRRVKDQPVNIRGELYLTLYGDRRETKVRIGGATQAVPGMGLCKATGGPPATYFLSCASALRPRADHVAVTFEPHPRVLADGSLRFPPSYSPFPAELSINPLTPSEAYSTYQGPLDAVTVSSEEPVAFVRAPLEIDGLRLGAYEVRMKN